jgi:hypothetical protein
MLYRPALVPVAVFILATLKNLTSAATDWTAWAYLACLIILLTATFLAERSRGQAWSWWTAIAVGFAIALAAWLGAAAVVNFMSPGAAQ